MCDKNSLTIDNDIVIDGVTEMDDLTLVTHIASTEYNRIYELQRLKQGRSQQSHIKLDEILSSEILDHESDSDIDVTIDNNDSNIHNSTFNDKKDLLDNLRIIDTVDLPDTVDHALPIDKIGKCVSIIDNIIIVESNKSEKILDLGSIVCKLDRTMLGTVNDTFGQTNSPFYVVITKFNPPSVEIGEDLYYDIKHSTLVTDYNTKWTDFSGEESSDTEEDSNLIRKPNILKQSYNDLDHSS